MTPTTPTAEYKALLRERDALRKALYFKVYSSRATLTAARKLAAVEEKILRHRNEI